MANNAREADETGTLQCKGRDIKTTSEADETGTLQCNEREGKKPRKNKLSYTVFGRGPVRDAD